MKILKLVALLPAFITLHSVALTDVQQNAQSKGIILFNQLRIAEPYLQIAAEAGNREAQYFLAEELRQVSHGMTVRARYWYQEAAKQGDLYAMVQLARQPTKLCELDSECKKSSTSPPEWKRIAVERATDLSNQGDGEAMYVLYVLSGNISWLEKSAGTNYGYSNWLLGNYYQDGNGFFLLPGSREKTVKKLYEASANAGYAKGMMSYGAILYKEGDIDSYREWSIKAAHTGYASSVYGLANDLAHDPDTLHLPYDIVKAYALISLLTKMDGGGGIQGLASIKLKKFRSKMTSVQINEAENLAGHWEADHWEADHHPISFYPPKLDY